MDRFLIESPHSPEDCRRVVKMTYALGYLNNFDWGCEGGDHKAWAVIEADDEKQALWSVPVLIRGKARAIRLVKFDPKMVEEWKEEEQPAKS